MKRLTQLQIQELAMDIYSWLKEREMDDALCIYYGNQRLTTYSHKMDIESDKFANDYCTYAPWDNVITISSEGMLYDYYNTYYQMPPALEKIWESKGLYLECNESWNWSLYPIDDDLEIEYYDRGPKPQDPMYIFIGCRERMGKQYPKELDDVMRLWYDLSNNTGDKGGCVIGAKMCFTYCGVDYEMAPASPWQGEGSWSPWVYTIEKILEGLGATEISWDCGRLD